jgi:ferredoxin-NADP reductase
MTAGTALAREKHLDELSPWNAKAQMLVCTSVIDEAPDVKTFMFRADGGGWFRYLPGQFVSLELPVSSEAVLRTYTISSSPSRPYSMAVTVKAQAASIGTRWMFENVRAGAKLKAYGPSGNFTLAEKPAGKYLFVSAGSGITPMMSMLRWLADCAPDTDVTFVNSARRPEEIIFRSELELLATRMPNLRLGFLAEMRSLSTPWSGLTGRIDAQKLALLAHDFAEREIFCCGPEPFMDAVSGIARTAGFDMAHYHQESFGPSGAAEPASAVEAAAQPGEVAATHAVRFSLSEVDGLCDVGNTLLQTARASGVRIPAACESGLCGTCKVMKIEGEVEMNHNGGILDHEIEEGYILACCSRPLTAVSIEA